MNIEEAKLYLEHTSKEDFNLEEWQKENRYQAIQVVLKEIERLSIELNQCMIERNNYLSRNEKAIDYIDKYLEREHFDYNILETNTIYNRDLFKVKNILQGVNKE